jgi:stress-induced morphogen
MDLADIEARIENGIENADATVTRARGDHDDDHLAATVVSPAFEGERLVSQHQLVYDALGDLMTDEIHALELTTRTPEETDE